MNILSQFWCWLSTTKVDEKLPFQDYKNLVFDEKKHNRFLYRNWNTYGQDRFMMIITENDIQKGLARKLCGGAAWNLLILPHKYQYVENQTEDIKYLFLITKLNQATRTSKIIFV